MIDVVRTPARLADGRPAAVFRLSAPGGIAVTVATLGATLMRIDTPDARGVHANVLLGYDDLASYPAAGGSLANAYAGATCGRYGNRIAGAAFTLDGVAAALVPNEGPNQLHGGPDGFHGRPWDAVPLPDGVRMTLRSPDGDGGFPGTLDAEATFRLIAPDTLLVGYRATTDRPTHVNLVSHPYFNLAGDGAGDILDHRLRIDADHFLPVDHGEIPTGERRAVANTPFDFRAPRTLADAMRTPDPQLRPGHGYDHCYILPGGALRDVARLSCPASGRTMTLATDQPGLQFYDGHLLAGSGFPNRAGLCLEAQAWPDTPNRPDFPPTRLDPGAEYRSELRLRFGVGD